MYEPSAAVTDWLLAAMCAASAGWCVLRKRFAWAGAFGALGVGAAAGALYHSDLKPTSYGPATWTAVSFLIAAGMLGLYLASAFELGVLGIQPWKTIAILSAGALFGGLALGLDDLGPFVATQALAMMGLIILWLRAWRDRSTGARWFVAAMAASAAAAVVRMLPIEFQLYWEWNHDGIYHVAQLPGLLLLARGVHVRGRPSPQIRSR